MGHKGEWAHKCPTGRRLTLPHHHTAQLSTVMHFVQAQMQLPRGATPLGYELPEGRRCSQSSCTPQSPPQGPAPLEMFSAPETEIPTSNGLNHENIYGLLKEFRSGLEEGQLNVTKNQASWNPSTRPTLSRLSCCEDGFDKPLHPHHPHRKMHKARTKWTRSQLTALSYQRGSFAGAPADIPLSHSPELSHSVHFQTSHYQRIRGLKLGTLLPDQNQDC